MNKRLIQFGTDCVLTAVFTCIIWFFAAAGASAYSQSTVPAGVYGDSFSLGGLTREEAAATINAYVDSMKEAEIVLIAGDGHTVTVTAGELGIYWANPEIIEEALTLGTTGNVVERYKARKDLEHDGLVYEIEVRPDISAIDAVLAQQCTVYNRAPVDWTLTRVNGEFVIGEGCTGLSLDIETSIDRVYAALTGGWKGDDCTVELDVRVTEPRGSWEELAMVTDVLGTYTTKYKSSGAARTANVVNGCRLANDILLYPGDEFSMLGHITPFSEANGYYMAPSYLNGTVVDSLGGGICQVSTTLYNAVLQAELDVTQRNNHSMVVSYVEPSMDAAIAESSGKDFKFVNNTDYPIYIEGITTDKKVITFNIYGVEYRPETHRVEYISEVLETTEPSAEVVNTSNEYPVGYISVTGAHTGYKAQLWMVVYEDGVEVSREVVNTSNYKMSPRTAVVGVATSDPNVYNQIMAAVATGDINYIKGVAATLAAASP